MTRVDLSCIKKFDIDDLIEASYYGVPTFICFERPDPA